MNSRGSRGKARHQLGHFFFFTVTYEHVVDLEVHMLEIRFAVFLKQEATLCAVRLKEGEKEKSQGWYQFLGAWEKDISHVLGKNDVWEKSRVFL